MKCIHFEATDAEIRYDLELQNHFSERLGERVFPEHYPDDPRGVTVNRLPVSPTPQGSPVQLLLTPLNIQHLRRPLRQLITATSAAGRNCLARRTCRM